MIRRTRVYVAGPISKGDRKKNMERLCLAGAELFEAGFAPFIPLIGEVIVKVRKMKIAALDDEPRRSRILLTDLAWVDASDALVRLPGKSAGATGEAKRARARGIPVYRSVKTLIRMEPVVRWDRWNK